MIQITVPDISCWNPCRCPFLNDSMGFCTAYEDQVDGVIKPDWCKLNGDYNLEEKEYWGHVEQRGYLDEDNDGSHI